MVASGYFDPLHVGHLEYLQRAKALGDRLAVIVNNDAQAARKKGRAFMPARERVRLVRGLACVDVALESLDEDGSVCRTLAALHPNVFANGGDQTNQSVAEAALCRAAGIRLVDGLGAKVQSSSWLLAGQREAHGLDRGEARPPAQRAELGAVHEVAPVLAGPVGHVAHPAGELAAAAQLGQRDAHHV